MASVRLTVSSPGVIVSTLLGVFLCLVFGGWAIALAFKLGALTIIASSAAVVVGLLYGLLHAMIEMTWHDDLVLFLSVYGFFGALAIACVWIKCMYLLSKNYRHRFED